MIRVIFSLFLTVLVSFLWADDWDDGLSSGGSYRSHFSSNMGSAIVDPLTKGKDFKTTDGKESFQASMTCDSKPRLYLEVGYNIVDKDNIVPFVRLDKNLNGNIQTYTSSYTAQGVCSNGIVVCPKNSNFDGKSQCKFYAWNYTLDGVVLNSNNANRDEMINCICINNSCSSPSVNNRKTILQMLGGGAYGAVASAETSVIVTAEPVSTDVISYIGQKIGDCENTNTGSMTNLRPGDGNIDPSGEMLAQGADEKSAYSSLMGGSSNYAENSDSFKSDVRDTVSTNKTAQSNLDHTDGTTTFITKGQSGSNINANVNVRLDVDNLEYCQVEWEVDMPTVYGDDTDRSSTNTGTFIEIETRECINGVCPYQSSIGEKVKHGCGKIDNFNEVTSGLMAVEEAAGDMICGSI